MPGLGIAQFGSLGSGSYEIETPFLAAKERQPKKWCPYREGVT